MAVVMITTKSQCRPSFLMSLSYVLFIILSIFFSFTEALNFSFNSFTPGDTRISCEGRAGVDPQNRTIKLIPDIICAYSVGRATYFEPLQLWDEVSGSLSDFTTRFSFVIDSQGNPLHGDGLAFFLAPAGSKLLLKSTEGGGMGLRWDNANEYNTNGDPFVAVEFDISAAVSYDPPFEHVGINVNSMLSVATTRWWYTLHEEKPNEAWISYNSSSKQLSVLFTSWNDSVLLEYRLSCEVDLKTVLPPNVTIGFSASTGNWTALHSIYSWDFNSTLLVGKSLDHKKKSQLVVGLHVGGGIIGGFVLAGICLWRWIKRSKEDIAPDTHLNDDFERGAGPRKFSYHEVKRATNNFNHEAKLGEGGFGGVYKGFLKELNSFVAVKKLSKESNQGIKEYASEVKVISQLRHRNLVKLIGWCHNKKCFLLVYEYMPNGSLDRYLLNATELLIWQIRYKIVQGLASALLYLHEGWEQYVVHRDIKPSNIMLDSGFNAKLGDFGLARLVDHAKGSKTTDVAGTRGYMAPEYVETSKATKESDVYSFGIVVLEIACGRRSMNPEASEAQIVMEDWVWELYEEGKVLEAADPRFNLGDYDEQQMEKLMLVGLWCAHPDCRLRPSIRQVNFVLNDEVPLPSLPPRTPIDPCSTAQLHLHLATTQLSLN